MNVPARASWACVLINLVAGATGRFHRSAGRSAAVFPSAATVSSDLTTRTSTGQKPRPIVFVKTHKTGSTTVANIVFRLGESRNQTFMLNCTTSKCSGHLGWPRSFPAKDAVSMWGPPAHQFDIICNHAVYNDERMRTYLRQDPFVFTILREPMERLESAFEYFPEYASLSGGWSERLRKLESLEPTSRAAARLRNSQAHDLGWHDWAGGTTNDEREDLMKKWITGLGRNLSFVMLTEHFDEGLVLLRRKLGLDLSDVRYLRVDPRGAASRRALRAATVLNKTVMNGAQSAALARHFRVDALLYAHFKQSFWREWEAAGGWKVLGGEVQELRAQNEALAQACSAQSCSWRFLADDIQFPVALSRAAVAS